jgi:hypothetical protein
MHKRFTNQTAITGYASACFSIPTFLIGGAKVSILAWVFVGIGIVLVLIGALRKPTRCPTLSEPNLLVEKRKLYLIPLKANIENTFEELNKLVSDTSKISLDEYADKYTFRKHKLTDIIRRLHPNDDSLIKLSLLTENAFPFNNLYYRELKDHDSQLTDLNKEYQKLLVQVKDKVLKTHIKILFWKEHWSNSAIIFSILRQNNTDNTLVLDKMFKVKGATVNVIIDQMTKINNRIDELLNGVEDE